jgi:hypothetical protein
MILQPHVRLADDGVRVRTGIDDEHGVHALLRAVNAPTTADSRTPFCSSSTRSTSSGKTLRPSGVTIISFLRP